MRSAQFACHGETNAAKTVSSFEATTGAKRKLSDDESAGAARTGGLPTVDFDVSGRIFRVAVSTIMKHPDAYLAKRLDQRWGDSANRDAKDPIFVDRSPTLFEHILNFYRNNAIHLPASVRVEDLNSELAFFGFDPSQIEVDCATDLLPFRTSLETKTQSMEMHLRRSVCESVGTSLALEVISKIMSESTKLPAGGDLEFDVSLEESDLKMYALGKSVLQRWKGIPGETTRSFTCPDCDARPRVDTSSKSPFVLCPGCPAKWPHTERLRLRFWCPDCFSWALVDNLDGQCERCAPGHAKNGPTEVESLIMDALNRHLKEFDLKARKKASRTLALTRLWAGQ